MLRKHSARCSFQRARISSFRGRLHQRRSSLGGRTMAAASLATLLFTAATEAQEGRPGGGRRGGEPVTFIKGGTVHTGTGEVLENATVIVRGSRIVGVRQGDMADVPNMPGMTVVDATGKHVYPGLIDADSRLLADPATFTTGPAKASNDIRDALDLHGRDTSYDRDEALAQGVTTVYVGPQGRGAIDGRGGVFKLLPAGSLGDIELQGAAAISGRLGLGNVSASGRLRELKGLRAALDGAKKYGESWDEYEEKLAEYEEKLAERRKEAGIEDPAEGDGEKSSSKGKGAPKKGDEEKGAGEKGADEKGGEGSDPEKKDDSGNGEGGKVHRPTRFDRLPRKQSALYDHELGRLIQDLIDQGYRDESAPLLQRRRPPQRPQGGASRGGGARSGGNGGKEDKDELQAPKRPGYNPDQEALRSVLAGEFPLRVQVDRPADILNLLAMQREYHFDLVIVGARGAGAVAEAIEEAGVPVVLGQGVNLADDDLDVAAKLQDAGVLFALSTTRNSAREARFLGLGAAAAVAGGLDADDALGAVTARAARLLGVSDRIGAIAEGKDADLVIASGPPLSSLSVVEKVLIDGKVVYSR